MQAKKSPRRDDSRPSKNGKPVSSKSPPTPATQKEFVLSALDQYERKLTAYATRLNHGDLHAARDAVQHTFMQLCKQDQAKVSPKLAPWLYTVCRNRVLDELDSKHRRSTKTLDGMNGFDAVDLNAIDPTEQIEIDEILLLLRKLFSCLPEPEREAIELWSHGFDASEIAEITNRKRGTVRVNLHRAIKRLRQHPEVAIWLERATGHFAKPAVSPNETNGLATNCTKTTSTFSKGERS